MKKNDYLDWSEIVRYETISEEVTRDYPVHADYYFLLEDILKFKKIGNKVLGISGVLPITPPRKLAKMNFISVNTNFTKYAALREVQSVFGTFYHESGIFPSIQVLPKEFLINPKRIARSTYSRLLERGTLIYGSKR